MSPAQPRRPLALILLAAAAATGCGRGGGPSCDEQAASVGRFLESLDTAPALLPVALDLVARDDVRPPDAVGPSLRVDGGQIDLAGQVVAPGELDRHLAELREQEATMGAPDADRLFVAISAKTTWADVVPVLEAVRRVGYLRPGLVFARPRAKVTPPPASRVDDRIHEIMTATDPSQRATEASRLMSEIVQPCAPLVRLFGQVAAVEGPGGKAQQIVHGVGPALSECSCKAEPAEVRAVLYALLAVEHPDGSIAVTLAEPGEAAALELPAATPWREASDRVVRAGTFAPAIAR